jgi:hypothetical protein
VLYVLLVHFACLAVASSEGGWLLWKSCRRSAIATIGADILVFL